MRSFTESMNSSTFDSDSDAIMQRMRAARERPQPAARPHNPSYKPLLFDDNDPVDLSTELLGPDMHSYINSRRAASEREVERFNTLGKDEYNRQTYGGRQHRVQMVFDDNGNADPALMNLVMKSHMANSQITEGAMLDGNLETDIRFLEGHDNVDGLNFLYATGERQQPSARPAKTTAGESSSQKPKAKPAKELNLKYNEKKKVPLLQNTVEKIKIIVEYKDGMQESHKNSLIKIVKSGAGKDNKTAEIEIKGEGKTITGKSYSYFFESTNDGYTDVTLLITGPGVQEATLMFC